MKKQQLHILVFLLVILQVYSLVKINLMQSRIDNVNNTINFVENRLENQISSIYQNVDQKLEEQASLIHTSSVTIGQLDLNTLTVPVTFTIEPKTVTDSMTVFLGFDGEVIRLEKSGLQYSVTKSFSIEEYIYPKLIIDDNGVQNIEESRELSISKMKEKLFPFIFARFSGETGYGSNEYRVKGCLEIDYKPSMDDQFFVEIKYVVKVDHETLVETAVPFEEKKETMTYDIDDAYSLDDGQIFTGSIVAIDNLGFIHEYLIMHYEAGSHSQREPYFEQEKIMAPNGEIVYMFDETMSTI